MSRAFMVCDTFRKSKNSGGFSTELLLFLCPFFALICTFKGAPNAIFAKNPLILNAIYCEAKGGADEWMKDLRTL